MAQRPFLDYYIANGISPVSQDISNMRVHINRRNALYRLLGIVPSFVRAKSVLEFGPGSGYNALHTLHLAPSRYLLVDGNPTGLEKARLLLTAEQATLIDQSTHIDYICSDFMAFSGDELFDVVLCEGFLSLQLDPVAMLRHLSSFVKPGGILVCTCIDAISYLPDLVRRACGQAFSDPDAPLLEQAARLTSLFAPHFATLPNMSRPLEDWVLDNVLHPFFGRLLSIPEAIDTLDDAFDIHGASPNFLTDWRWYKDICAERSGGNAKAKAAWLQNAHNFIDHSVVLPEREGAANRELLICAENFVQKCFAYHDQRSPELLHGMSQDVLACALNLSTTNSSGGTVTKLKDAATALEQTACGSLSPDFGTALSLFGRASQYVSFIRVA